MKLSKSLDYDIIKQFALENNIEFVAIYGSYYYGNSNSKSDIDLIIDSKKTLSNDLLLKFSKELNVLLKKNVDLITPRMMISSLICGYVWRLKQYEVIFGCPVVSSVELTPV